MHRSAQCLGPGTQAAQVMLIGRPTHQAGVCIAIDPQVGPLSDPLRMRREVSAQPFGPVPADGAEQQTVIGDNMAYSADLPRRD